MPDDGSSQETHDPRLNRILAEYLEAVEQGSDASPDDWIDRHPEFADELREFFAGRQRLDDLVSPGRAAEEESSEPDGQTVLTGHEQSSQGEAAPFRVRYFGEYELLDEIARGGMGVVYRARQSTLKRVVALKMILSGLLAGEEDVKRFYAEAEAAAKLDHPNIVPIFEIGQHDGQHYFSMAFVEGESLARRVADGPLPPREATQLVKKVAEAVAFAHVEGVVHRDLKPANVLLDKDGEPRVTDFGLAKKVSAESLTSEATETASLTATGQILGTPSYMPPEQASGKTDEIGPLADVYALGAMLYCLLTGRPPFQAASPLDTLLQVLQKDPVPLRQLDPKVPRDLETICLKCLEKDPRRRYASASKVADDLQRYLSGEPVKARPISRPARVWRWCRRNPVVAGLTGLAATLLAVVGIVASVGYFSTSAALHQSQRHLYVAHLNLAQQGLNSGEDRRALGLLERHVPVGSNQSDLRGWEWHYLRSRCRIALNLGADMGSVSSVAWSPNGRQLASGGSDGVVRIWDVGEGLEAGTLLGKRSFKKRSVRAREWLFLVDPEGAPVGRTDDVEAVTLRGHEVSAPTWALAWSPDGRRLASASMDKTVRIWDVSTHRELHTLRAHTNEVLAIAWTSDGQRLASGSKDQTVRVWDATTGEELLRLPGHFKSSDSSLGGTMVLSWRADNRELASACNDETKFWDATTGEEIRSLDKAALTWSPDGKRFANERSVVDAATGKQLLNLSDSWSSSWKVAWSPDGRRLLQHTDSAEFNILDAVTGEQLLALRGGRNCFSWSPDSRYVATAGSGTILVWDTTPELPALTLTGTADRKAYSIAWSPDGNLMAVAEWAGSPMPCDVKVWDTATGKLIRSLSGHTRELHWVDWSGDGEYLASIDGSGTARVWDTQSWQEVATLSGLGSTGNVYGRWCRLSWSPDSQFLAGASGHKTLKVWQKDSWQEVLTSDAPQRPEDRPSPWVRHLIGWTSEGRLLFEGTNPNSGSGLQSWDAVSGQEPVTLRQYMAWSSPQFLSPDGQWIAAPRGEVSIWGVTSKRSRPNMHGHDATHVAWSPDGRRLASVAQEGTLKLWDVESGQELLTLPGGSFSVAFSPDGWRLAASQGNTVTIWNIGPRSRDASTSSDD